MSFDRFHLFLCKLSGFIQYPVGNSDFSDIMQKRDVIYSLLLFFGHIQPSGYLHRIGGHPQRMSVGVLILGVDSVGKGAQRFPYNSFILLLPLFEMSRLNMHRQYRSQNNNG